MTDYDPSDHTVEEVQQYLAEHPEERDAVLAAEAAGKNRTTLVNSAAPESAPQPAEQAEESTKPEDASISPPGEYPEEGIFGYKSDEPGVQAGQ